MDGEYIAAICGFWNCIMGFMGAIGIATEFMAIIGFIGMPIGDIPAIIGFICIPAIIGFIGIPKIGRAHV